MAGLIRASIDEIGRAIARGDAQSARWLLDRVDFAILAKQIFEQEVNPTLAPESMTAIVDEIAEARIDEFFRQKGIGPLERLRLGPALKEKVAGDLREEYPGTDDEAKE